MCRGLVCWGLVCRDLMCGASHPRGLRGIVSPVSAPFVLTPNSTSLTSHCSLEKCGGENPVRFQRAAALWDGEMVLLWGRGWGGGSRRAWQGFPGGAGQGRALGGKPWILSVLSLPGAPQRGRDPSLVLPRGIQPVLLLLWSQNRDSLPFPCDCLGSSSPVLDLSQEVLSVRTGRDRTFSPLSCDFWLCF